MKCLKIYYQKIKFYFKFLKLILSKNYFRNFYLFREYNSKSTNIIKDLRELLKLKPYWSQGHYLLGILSFLEYRNSKDAHYLGSLNMSKIALNELRSNNNKTNFLNLLLKFLNKKFEDIINDKSINKLMSNSNDMEKSLIFEIRGFSYFILNKEDEALKDLKAIPLKNRDKEIATLIKKLGGEIK